MSVSAGSSLSAMEEELHECERERRDALVSDDMERLSAVLADDLVHVHTTGNVHGKAEVLNHVSRVVRFFAVERGPLLIRQLADDVAVMTGPMTNVVGSRHQDERITVEAYVTQVWARRDGSWQLASFHAVRLPV